MAKFTEGKWELYTNSRDGSWWIETQDGHYICGGVDYNDEPVYLLLAAPELLELLKEWLCTPFFATEAEWEEWVKEYRPRVIHAIQKAEGNE